MKMLNVIAIVLALASAKQSFALELIQGGQVVTCQNKNDYTAGVTGYRLFAPAAAYGEDKVVVAVNYLAAKCDIVNNAYTFVPRKMQAEDMIVLHNPHLFTADAFFSVVDQNGTGIATFSLPYSTVLSKSEVRHLAAGKTVSKTFYLRYGNRFPEEPALKDESYGMSNGYYALVIELSGATKTAKVVGFDLQ